MALASPTGTVVAITSGHTCVKDAFSCFTLPHTEPSALCLTIVPSTIGILHTSTAASLFSLRALRARQRPVCGPWARLQRKADLSSQSKDDFSAALNSIRHFECDCHPFVQDWNTEAPKAIREVYAADPDAFLRKAFGNKDEPADLCYLCVLTSDLVEDPDVRTMPVLEKFIDMIYHGYNVPDRDLCPQLKTCLWERPMIGIVNSLQTLLRPGANKRMEERASVKMAQGHYKKILDIIRDDLLKLLPDTKHANHLRLTAIKFIAAMGAAWGLDE